MAAQKITPPNTSALTKIPNVYYTAGAGVVVGLEPTFQQGKLAIVKTTGLSEEWFTCKYAWDAEEIMKKYHSGEYTKVEWFT